MAHKKDQPYPFLGQQAILYLWGGHREMQMSGLNPIAQAIIRYPHKILTLCMENNL